jgi:hypothetical protein
MPQHFLGPTRRIVSVGLTAALVSLLVLGCSAAATPSAATQPSTPAAPSSQSPSTTPSQAPASHSARPITLRQTPDNLGCDAIGVDYTRMTFHIDPDATEQVVAVTDTNVQLLTSWPAGFRQAPGGEPAIVDGSGRVVATDGQVLEKAAADATRLAGYFVCLGPSEIYVLMQDPS